MVFGTKHSLKTKADSLKIKCDDGTYLHRVDQIKYLGIWLDPEFTFKTHIYHIRPKINFGSSVLYSVRKCFTFSVRKIIIGYYYIAFF